MKEIQQDSDYLTNDKDTTKHLISWIVLKLLIM